MVVQYYTKVCNSGAIIVMVKDIICGITLFLDCHLAIRGIKGSIGFLTKILCSTIQLALTI